MTSPTATERYRAARDVLLRQEDFAWPVIEGRFNWAVDWFDAIARGNERTALWIVQEDGTEAKYSFAELAHRSDQLAHHLAGLGVAAGDRVLLMLGNQVELWEAMLAVMKLGAVIMPTTTALGAADLADRIGRGGARHVVANAGDTAKFTGTGYTRIVVGGAADGWAPFEAGYRLADPAPFTATTAPDDPLLVYFTSGTTSLPKMVEHTQVSYPVGHLTTMAWAGLRPGDVHLNISSPGWAKHAWSCFFAPWIAEATIFVHNYTRFDAPACWSSCAGPRSPPSAPRRRSGGCSSRPSWASARRRCAS